MEQIDNVDKNCAPTFVVTLRHNDLTKQIKFSELKTIKNEIKILIMLWKTNSYVVNCEEGYFIINGGRKIVIKDYQNITGRQIEYYKRNRMEVSVNSGSEGKQMTSYLMGFVGKRDAENLEVYLHISEDGHRWAWKYAR